MTIKEIANMSYFDIRKMDKNEMYKLLRYAKAQSDKRITNYYKANEPGKKGIVERGVVQIITPGTIFDESLTNNRNNYITLPFV